MTVYQEAHTRIDQLPEETVLLFIQLMDKMSPNVIEKEYFGNYERFWILCRSERRVYCDTAAPFVQYQEAPDASGQV